jgi:hypothetical protein
MFYKAPNTYINEGTQFTIDGVTYPSNWLNQSTPEQKAALGLQEVVASNQPFDPKYYWTGETLDGATLTYTGTPKDLADVQKQAIAQVDATAYSILLPSDYMAGKAFETGTTVPTEWADWRESIRATARAAIADITAAQDVDTIAALTITWANDPNYVEPVEVTEEPAEELEEI